jgi:hypothetical protein
VTLAECRPGRKVRFTSDGAEGWILYSYPAPQPPMLPGPQLVTVQYWSPMRFAWLTKQFTPEQLEPAPERATDDVPGRPA